jgi:putative ABC transport system ATP-binding protein
LSGRVIVDGQDVAQLAPSARDRFRGRHIGVVIQQLHLLPTLTALQNPLVAQSIAGVPVDRPAARSVLHALGVDERLDAPASAFGRAAAARGDRPRACQSPEAPACRRAPSNLDDDSCGAVADLMLGATAQYGASLVIATHDMRLKSRMARQVTLPRRPDGIHA